MGFGIGFSVAPIGEQPDNLEAIRRAAAYQDCHRHRVTTVLDRLAGDWRAAVGCIGGSPRAISSRERATWRAIAPAAVMAITKWRFDPTQSPLQRTPAGGFIAPRLPTKPIDCKHDVLLRAAFVRPRFRTVQLGRHCMDMGRRCRSRTTPRSRAKMMPKRRRSGTGRGRRTAEEWLHE